MHVEPCYDRRGITLCWYAFHYAHVCLRQMFQHKHVVWHSVRVLFSFFTLAVCPTVHAFPVDIAFTSMCSHTVTHLVLVPGLDMAAHLKDDVSHHFSLLTPPQLLGSAGSCQTQSGMQWGIRRPGICPLSVTAADWQWLPAWQSLTQLPRGLGSKCYHYYEEGCHHFLPLEHGSTRSKSGRSALAFSVVWMTRYYSSCSDNGSCTAEAIKVIRMLSPSVSKTNVELYDSTFDALWLRKWAHAWRRILP